MIVNRGQPNRDQPHATQPIPKPDLDFLCSSSRYTFLTQFPISSFHVADNSKSPGCIVLHILLSLVAGKMLFERRLVKPLIALLQGTLAAAADTESISATSTSAGSTSAGTPTSSSTGIATHTFQVGPKSDPHQYVPTEITANVGDIVVFEFYPTNHSVVKADYLAPCVPASGNIFYSGAFDTFNENDGQLVGPVSVLITQCTAKTKGLTDIHAGSDMVHTSQ
jgi:plastocyanin